MLLAPLFRRRVCLCRVAAALNAWSPAFAAAFRDQDLSHDGQERLFQRQQQRRDALRGIPRGELPAATPAPEKDIRCSPVESGALTKLEGKRFFISHLFIHGKLAEKVPDALSIRRVVGSSYEPGQALRLELVAVRTKDCACHRWPCSDVKVEVSSCMN